MSTLLVIRHGQARLFTEDYDRLSELGIQQAARLGEWMASRKMIPHTVYAGTLTRQQHTAEVVSDAIGKTNESPPTLQVMSGLNEYPAEEIMRILGPALRESDAEIDSIAIDYEQATDFDIRYRSLHRWLAATMQYWIAGDYDVGDSLMSWQEFSGGVVSALKETMQCAGKGETIAVFTSGGPVGVSVQSVLNAPNQAAADLNWRVHNCSVTKFTFSGDRISLDGFNDTAHLPPEMLTYR